MSVCVCVCVFKNELVVFSGYYYLGCTCSTLFILFCHIIRLRVDSA